MNIEDKIKDLVFMTRVINGMARDAELDFCYTDHVKLRMIERGLTTDDILFILRRGVIDKYQGKGVHKEDLNIHKYKMTGVCLKDDREIGIVILVEVDREKDPAIKIQDIVTIMWKA